jgi:hypothetical protein
MLRLSEKRVLKRKFGSRTNEITGGWRKLHSEELHNLYSSPSIIRMIKSRVIRWAEHVAHANVLLGKPEGKRLLGGHKSSWKITIKWIL